MKKPLESRPRMPRGLLLFLMFMIGIAVPLFLNFRSAVDLSIRHVPFVDRSSTFGVPSTTTANNNNNSKLVALPITSYNNTRTHVYSVSAGADTSKEVEDGDIRTSPFSGSQKLYNTNNPHAPDTYWLVRSTNADQVNLASALQDSLAIRFARRNWPYNATAAASANPLYHQQVYQIMMEDNWKLMYHDGRDRTQVAEIHEFLRKHVLPTIGWKYVYVCTRSTTSDPFRNMQDYHSQSNWTTKFSQHHLGGIQNFTASSIGIYFAGVKHISYHVREDLWKELQHQFQARIINSTTNNSTTHLLGTDDDIDPIVTLPRSIHVATFLDPAKPKYSSSLRGAISTAVQQLGHLQLEQHGHNATNLTILTSVSGEDGKNGRNSVQVDYVRDLLNTQIYVLCQRDGWEDHVRLFEAMISGALVLTDPMRDFPTGLVDQETIVVYTSIADMQHKVLYYLNHEAERWKIAQRGRNLTLHQHRAGHRSNNLLLGDWSIRDENGISVID
eukprot:scaffold22059_cov52-Attheya_sp.AAC.1